MTTTIQPTPDYLLHFSVNRVLDSNDFNLKVESQWWGARDRNSLQTKFDVTLPECELRRLADTIEAGVGK